MTVHDKRSRTGLEKDLKRAKILLHKLGSEFDFLEQAVAIPLIREEQEIVLAIQMENGDETAKQALMQANLGLVVTLVLKHCKDKDLWQDAFQEGCLGLLRAVENFDHTKGFRLADHAIWWISQSISHFIENQSELPSLSVEQMLLQGKEDDLTEKAAELEMWSVPDENSKEKVKRKFIEVIDELSDLERTISFYLYGLDGRKPLSIKQISKKLEVSEFRIAYTDEKILNRLQTKMGEF